MSKMSDMPENDCPREAKNGSERESELAKIECAANHFAEIGMNDYAKSTPDDRRV